MASQAIPYANTESSEADCVETKRWLRGQVQGRCGGEKAGFAGAAGETIGRFVGDSFRSLSDTLPS